MFSTKITWYKFASSFEELDNIMGERETQSIFFNNLSLLLVKHQNAYFLVKNKCPHQGVKLNQAKCENGFIVCPYHRFGFDLKTGRGGGLYLDNYPLEKRQDGIYAGFETFSWF